MSFLGSTPMCTGLCWYLAAGGWIPRNGLVIGHTKSKNITPGGEGRRKKNFSWSLFQKPAVKKNGRSESILIAKTDKWYQKLWRNSLAEPFGRCYAEKLGHIKHWQSPLAPQRSFQIRSLPITWKLKKNSQSTRNRSHSPPEKIHAACHFNHLDGPNFPSTFCTSRMTSMQS